MAPPERALTSLATISAPGPVLPQSAPQVNGLARSSSNSSSLNSVESAYIAYDRRDTLKPSPPNPTITKSPSTKSNTSQGGGSISSLDALEDLLLMAREEAADDDGLVKDANGAQALLEDFLAPSRSKNRDLGRSRSDHEEIDDVSATPRAPTRIPGSKSSTSDVIIASSTLSLEMNPDASSKRMPQMAVFDLDYTLWDCWCDTHVTPPMKRRGKDDVNLVYDKHGQALSFYPDVPGVLMDLHRSKIHIAAASRTHAPRVARQILTELLIPGSVNSNDLLKPAKAKNEKELVSAINLFDSMEIYPGSKITHFQELHKKTGIPYSEMIFFDDEPRNREVTKLGVTFVLVREGEGVHRRLFESGLESWRKAAAN
ncbi:hypothetical protein JCM11491_005416 [Sporobolomyces phaffii]